eukprot:5744223-Prymnesium_polylepis.1
MPSARAQLLFQWKGLSQQSVRRMGAQSSPSSHTTHAMWSPLFLCVCVLRVYGDGGREQAR